MREIAPGHQVYANDFEFEQMKKAYNNGGKGNLMKKIIYTYISCIYVIFISIL